MIQATTTLTRAEPPRVDWFCLAQLRGFAADFADPEKFFLCKSEPRLWITAEFPL